MARYNNWTSLFDTFLRSFPRHRYWTMRLEDVSISKSTLVMGSQQWYHFGNSHCRFEAAREIERCVATQISFSPAFCRHLERGQDE